MDKYVDNGGHEGEFLQSEITARVEYKKTREGLGNIHRSYRPWVNGGWYDPLDCVYI